MDPTLDPDELVRQILGAGLYQPRLQQLQQRIGMGQQMLDTPGAQGAHVGQTYVASSPLEHLGVALRRMAGQRMVNEGQASERNMLGQVQQGRQSFADAILGATQPIQAPPSGIAAPGMDQASQEAAQQGRLRQLGLLGSLSGDPQMEQAGASAATMPGQMLATALQKQKLANEGPQEALGGVTEGVFNARTKRNTEEANTQNWDHLINPLTGEMYLVNKKSGQAKPIGGGSGGSGAGSASLTPQALDQLAEMFHTTGQLPPVGRGPSAALTIKSIVNRAAEMHPDASLAGNKAGFKADSGSLAKLQTQADSIESFENTALKNLDNFLKTADGVIDVGSPLFNRPLRSLDARVLGDVNTAKFNTARQVAIQEIGKVLGGAVQGGAISDSQRHEVADLLSGDMSLAQIKSVSDVLKQDMSARKTAVNAQLGTVRARVGGQAAPADTTATPALPPDAAALRKKYGL